MPLFSVILPSNFQVSPPAIHLLKAQITDTHKTKLGVLSGFKKTKKNKLPWLNRHDDLTFPENKLGYIKSAKPPGGHNRGFAIWLQVI